MNVIETHALAHRYWRKEALHRLDLAVPAGQVCGLLGANGAGKSTAIKVLMNLLYPTAGEARVLGVDSRQLGETEKSQIGYVSEDQKLPLWMTVQQLLDFCRPFYPTWDVELERRLLGEFDLPPDRKLKHLSRGMLMKASLLSSLAYRPKLLVMDEPFGGLDPLSRHEFIHGILEATEFGDWTVLVASHDVEEIERLADQIVVLENGWMQCNEATESLLGRFRRVELVLPDESTGGTANTDWLEFQRKGGLIQFIAPHYRAEATEQECAERFPGAVASTQPMTLREIFIVLARESRRLQKGGREA